MRADLWTRANRLAAAALELPKAARAAFVEANCEDDEELSGEVLGLLAADEAAGTFLERPVARFADPEAGGGEEAARFGPYRVLREIGRGGTGIVYLAQREDGVSRRRVALKVLRGLLPELRRRFHTEREVLAALEHPSIARLYDGGTASDGRPYLVMEYVEGLPIDAWCDQHRLTIDQRLALFGRVCDAVHYAHRNLLVHRDLKPANILVTADGTPKLLDFGIAKLLGGRELDATVQETRTGLRLMTPAWASPEQVQGRAITTATDVYALGLLLFRLLTGRGPYRLEHSLPHEIERRICEEDPERPSQAVERPAERDEAGSEVLSRARRTTPRELRRRLRGDLDTIVQVALRKEPERRYGSAEQLAEDVERHLGDRPLRVRPESLRYRAGKFVRRNTLAVLASATLVVLLLGFSIVTALQALRIARGREAAEHERQKAQQVSDFLTRLFDEADPRRAQGREVTVREVLDRGVREIERFDAQPEIQAAFMNTLGEVYISLGRYDEAAELLDRGLALRRRLYGEEHPDVAESLAAQGALRFQKGDYARAEALMRQALAIRRRLLGAAHPELARSMNDLAVILDARGKPEDAEKLYHEALAMRRRLFGERHEDVASTLYALGRLTGGRGDYAAAEPLLEQAAAIQRELLGVHPDLGTTLNELAWVRHARGDYEAALPLFEEALDVRRRLHPEGHAEVAVTLNDLGLLQEARGDYAAAEPLLRRAVEMQRRLLGGEHPYVATSMSNLGRLLWRMGRGEEAERLHRQALDMRRRTLGDEHPHVAVSLSHLGLVLADRGELTAAEPLLLQAVELERRLLGEAHPRLANSLSYLGLLRARQGDLEAAEARYREALEMRQRLLGDDHPDVARSWIRLGRTLLAEGDEEAAETALRRAVAILAGAFPEGHWRRVHGESVLGACLAARGRPEQAEPLLRRGLEILHDRIGAAAPETREVAELIERFLPAAEASPGLKETARRSGGPGSS